MVDWDAGRYERTAAELEPVARVVVDAACSRNAGERVASFSPAETGNARRCLPPPGGPTVVGVDAAPRLLEVARERARSRNVKAEFLQGDLLALPIADGSADVVLSVFGLIFAPDPARALAEVARVAAPGARVFVSAWIPAGPINDMLGALGQVVARVTEAPAPPRFPWSDAAAVEAAAGEAGLSLHATTRAALAIHDTSPEAYVGGWAGAPRGARDATAPRAGGPRRRGPRRHDRRAA